jgi:hypothetical protein
LLISGFSGEESQSALSLFSYVPDEVESLIKEEPIPSSLSGVLEKHSALSSSQWNRHLKDFSHSYSQTPELTSITLTLEDMQGTSVDLSIEMGETCAIGSEKKTEMLTAENCFRD